MADGIYYRDSKPPFAVADYGSVTASTTFKAMWTPTAAGNPCAVPANYMQVGKTLKLTANIKHTAVANTNNIQWGLGWGTADNPGNTVSTAAVANVSST